ncbi:hypothetical protein AF79_01505 [Aliarcobacter butzleri L354]|uniref:AMP-binding protein n=1 Tax=Aliarcobacter butzleri TaxID=28197 RepID=UPI00063AEE96|nr:AMP-binding protein [Aliarcobacter butzleri]KLE11289.1 hypothetical protein AF79_01505 [Aliarcobacter butzleri L354]MCT7577394.1 AMP-binding protein [Aliarcobacter butzleri]
MNIIKLKQYSKYFIKNLIQKNYLHNGDLREYQLSKINQVLNDAQQNSLFYQEFYKNSLTKLNSLEDIKKLPILKKDIFKKSIQENTILCNGYDKKNLDCGHTTGSTGTPLEMCFDKECTSKRALVQSRLWKDIGILPYKRFVKIWRDKKLSKSEQKLKDAGLLLPIAVGDVNDPISSATTNEKLQNILDELQSFDPQVIRGYVSSLYSIASLVELHNIKFKNLESIVTSAEYLPSQMWKYFEKVFGCTVYNLYGGTEAPSIAVNKKDSHNLTISEDLYFIEVLDENGNDVKAGEQGLITITDLYSNATPLIRYQIGDMAIVDDNFYKFFNNFRYFCSVEGRTNDIFELEDGSLIYSHLWFVYFRELNWINRFKVIQNDKKSIHILLELKNNNKDFSILKNKIESIYPKINFTWEIIDRFSLDSGDKFRSVISYVPNKFNTINKEI